MERANWREALSRKRQHAFEQALWEVCAPYVQTNSPMRTLCKRIERFLPELARLCGDPWCSLHTTIWLNAVFVHWSSLAKSVVVHAVPRAVRRAWVWLLSLAPGSPRNSIPSTNVWRSSLSNLLSVKSEQFPLRISLDTAPKIVYSLKKRMKSYRKRADQDQ